MASITFDTLKFAEKLIAAGVPEAQAKAEASALSEVLEINLRDLVTKEHLDYKLAELKADLIKWVVGLCFGHASGNQLLSKFQRIECYCGHDSNVLENDVPE